jgi:uncharacterized damage-inducible protein DinB
MKSVQTTTLLAALSEITSEISRKLQTFSGLTAEQRSWQPSNEVWSINHIFAHLNQYAEYYHETIEKKLAKTRFRDPKPIFISSPLGRASWRSMKLGNAYNVKRKMKSPRDYNPLLNGKSIRDNEIELFLAQQERMMQILELASGVNLRKVKIPLSISKIIKFRLGDCLQFVIYHNERHLQQALNLTKHPRFPKND